MWGRYGPAEIVRISIWGADYRIDRPTGCAYRDRTLAVLEGNAMAEIVTLADAVSQLIADGDCVAMEGFTHLIPHAAGHEVMRQRKRELRLVRMTPDLIYDQLIGAGCAAALRFSWGGNPGVGSDLPRVNDSIKFLQCPYTGETLATSPAVNPDVTVIHAQQADRRGNVLLWGILGVQKEAALAARKVIVTVEEVVDTLDGPAQCLHPAALGRRCVVPGSRWRGAVVRARLLRA